MGERHATPPAAPAANPLAISTPSSSGAQGQLFAPDEPAKTWPQHRLEVPPLRQCTTCWRLLPLDLFGDNWRTRDGIKTRCNDCNLVAARINRGVRPTDAHRRPSPDDCCAICGSDGGTRGLFLDHDHDTGRFRDWLCHHCNSALGHLQDNPGLVERARLYLEAHGRSAA